MKDIKDRIIEKQDEIIHDMFFQTGYSNGKLHKELTELKSQLQDTITTKDLQDDDKGKEERNNNLEKHGYEFETGV